MGLIDAVTNHLPRADAPAVHASRHRDLRLDACRGLALWFIFIDHIPDNALTWLTLRNYGFSDTSEVFVFVSGYTCMLAYGGALREQGWLTTAVRALRRGWEIYAAFLVLLVAYSALVWVIGGEPAISMKQIRGSSSASPAKRSFMSRPCSLRLSTPTSCLLSRSCT
jgi:hypothetical protein